MKHTEKLIIKYLTNSISKKEWDELNLWIEQSEDTETLNDYIKINYAIEDSMSEFNTEKTKNSILEKIRKDKRSVITLRIRKYLQYAAAIVLFLGVGYYFQQEKSSNTGNEIALPADDTITLELENGGLEVLSEEGAMEIVNSEGEIIGTQKGNRLVYTGSVEKTEELVYNQITVPYGKRFELELSDGTVAHLNSGSSLKYPVKFLKTGERKIFLVGEVFLDVAKDSNRLFTVNTSDNLDVQVLGTQFNVSNYPEDSTTEVVLVEGSVGLKIGEDSDSVILEPGFKGSFNRTEKNISTKPVITNVYTSWIQGDLVFRNMSFENMLTKLERHYNVQIINENREYSQKVFNANFGDEPIDVVLNYFKNTYGINYTINENKITLN